MQSFVRWVFQCLVFFGTFAGLVVTAHAQASPEVTRGLVWLNAQVQENGEMLVESPTATLQQVRCETATTLIKLLGTTPKNTALVATLNQSGAQVPTQSLACQQRLQQQLGQTLLASEIETRRIAGQAYGAFEGYAVPNALDSGWAISAQLQNLSPQDKARLLAWFQANQAGDGSFAVHTVPDLMATAAVLRGLKDEASQSPVAAAIASKAAGYLLGRRNAAGHWSDDAASSALIFEAVHPYTSVDVTIATGVASYLLGKQLPNGSWADDAFVTAVALRALTMSAQPAQDPSLSVLRVKFVDARNNAALPGVVLTAPSSPTTSGTSDAQGQVQLGALVPGTYQLQAVLNGYAALNFTVSLTAGQVLDAGVLQMIVSSNQSVSVVTGLVRDQSNNAPLAGATVSVSPQSLTATTTADGRYLISGVTPGNITVSVDKAGFASAASSGTVLAGQVLNFSPLLVPSSAPGQAGDCSVQGLVTDAISRLPLAGVTVNLGGVVTRTTVTDAQGRYSLPGLSSGAVALTTVKAGYDSVNASTRLVCRVGRATVVDFSPRLYATAQTPPNANTSGLSGVVIDARTNQPIANAALIVTPEVGAPVNALSAADGTFSIAGLNGANVQLSVTATGYQGITLQFALTPLTVTDLGQIRLRPPTVEQLLPDFKVMVVKRVNARTDPQTLQLTGRIDLDISNVGTQSAPSGVVVLAFSDVNRNDAFDRAVDMELGQTTLATALPPGQTTTVQIDVGGTLAFRDAPIHVVVDPAQQIPEISKANNVRSSSLEALYTPVAQNFNPTLKWAWSGSARYPQYNQVMMAPVVGPFVDTNGDGVVDGRDNPCVIFVTFGGSAYTASGVIRVLDGVTGAELMSIVDSQNGVAGVSGLALADLDGDGRPELIAITSNVKAVVFKNDGSRLWTSATIGPIPPYGVWSTPSIADLDGDGSPEILIQNTVLNANGTIKWTTSGNHTGANTPIVSDLFDVGQQNVILGASVHTAGGSLLWQAAADGFSAVADFEGAGQPSIVVVGGGFVHLYSREGVLKWRVAVPSGGGGPPTIADADGDGVPDIGVAGSAAYTVFRADGSVMWSRSAQDYSSAITGSTFFDFDGSGSATALYADETRMRGFKGSTGETLWSIPNSSGTGVEYPLVVDVDRDGHADLVVVANNYYISGVTGIRVFQDVNNAWVPTRSIWNQHAYSINNINDDLTVPRRPVPSWKSHNTFRLNKRMGADARAIADLTVGYLRVADAGAGGGSALTVRVGNAGSYLIPIGTKLAVYNTNPALGQPAPSARLGTASTTQELQPGQWQDIVIPIAGSLATVSAGNTIWIVGDDDGTGRTSIADFDRSNNTLMGDLSAIALNLKILVATDRPIYTERDQAVFTGTVTNQGSFARDAIVRYTVLDAQGQQVHTLPVGNAVAVPASASVAVPALWSAAGTLAGNYQVKAELVTPLGVVYGSATANFAIQAGQSQFNSARITTDRSSYTGAQTVQLTAQVSNLTSNLLQADLRSRTTVLGSNGASAFSQTEAIAQLVAGGQRQYTYSLPAAGLAPGSYSTQLQLLNAQGSVLAQHTGTFTVQPTDQSGVGLSGTLLANPASTVAGGTVALSATVRNLGNAAISNAALTISIVDPTAQRTIASWPYSAPIAQGASFGMAPVWNTSGSVPNTYVAVLSTTLGGSSQTLATANIVVTGSSTKPSVNQSALRQGRLLMLVSCRNGEDGYADQGTVPVEIPDAGPGADDAKCTASRVAFVKKLLTTAGVPHYVTANVDDFTYALRGGQFNIYWISGGADKLTDGLALEIREAVNRGDGLLVDGVHDARNKLLDEVVGLEYRGDLLTINLPITFTMDPITGATLQTTGRPLKYKMGNSALVAKFPSGILCPYCPAADERSGTNTATNPSNPAIVGNAYGRGKGVRMAFDLIGSIQNQPGNPNWNAALKQTFDFLLPEVPEPYTSGAYAAVRTSVGNTAPQTTSFRVAYTVPTGGKALAAEPYVPLLTGAPQAQWDFSLAASQSKDLTLYLRAPTSTGRHFVGTAVNLMAGGQISLPGSYPFALQVVAASDAVATSKLITDLNALAFTVSRDQQSRDQAVRSLQAALAPVRPELAITQLLAAVDTLRLITSKDMTAYRLQVNRWMQELAYQWQTAQPLRNIP